MKTAAAYADNSADAVRLLQERLGIPVVASAAEIVLEEVQDVIASTTPAGREYTAADGSTRRRSAPGQAPAEGEGVYLAGWANTPPVINGRMVEAATVNDVRGPDGESVGVALEYGTERAEPRPHARPAAAKAAPRVAQLAHEASGR